MQARITWLVFAVLTLALLPIRAPARAEVPVSDIAQHGRRPGEQQGQPTQTAEQLHDRLEQPRQVRGVVLADKRVQVRGANERNLVVLIETHRKHERLAIDLGPADRMAALDIAPGDRIAVEGRMHRIRDRQFLVADRVRAGGRIASVDRSHQTQWAAREARERGAVG